LLDPPTEDVTARCISMLAQIGDTADKSEAVARAVDDLRTRRWPREAGSLGHGGVRHVVVSCGPGMPELKRKTRSRVI